MKKTFSILIRAYQLTISPILRALGGGCRFHPSCSEYSKEAFNRYSWPKAMRVSAWRILRCNPLNPGGLDPVAKD